MHIARKAESIHTLHNLFTYGKEQFISFFHNLQSGAPFKWVNIAIFSILIPSRFKHPKSFSFDNNIILRRIDNKKSKVIIVFVSKHYTATRN